MKTQQEAPGLSPISGEQWETLEEAETLLSAPGTGRRARRTLGEIEGEIAQDVYELEALCALPHPANGMVAEDLLDVSDRLRLIAHDERSDDAVLHWRGSRRRFGRRPPPDEN